MPTGSPSVAAGAALAFRAADDTAHWYAVASWNAEIDRQRAEADALAREKARAVLATPSPRKSPSTSPGMSSHGPHSDAWWVGVAICEQGRNGRPYNAPYFGYFSIMDGSASGLDWATQVSMANAIIARYGDGAWAASCVAKGYAAAPGG